MAERRGLRVPGRRERQGGAEGARRQPRAAHPRRRGVERRDAAATTPASARRGCSRSPTARTRRRRSPRSTPAPTTTCTARSRARELLARARAGLRAAQQRSDDTLLRALMVNVPGAIYRSAWHAGHTLELISDEIERISGYPPENFIASAKRTLMSIVHPDDHERVMARGRPRRRRGAARSSSSTGSCAPTATCAGCSTAASSSAAPAGGCGWTARSSTSPSGARPRRRCAGARSRRRARRSCARRAPASSRPPTPRGARSSATCTTAPSSGS